MSEPTEIEKKIAAVICEDGDNPTASAYIEAIEHDCLDRLLVELVERRLRAEYLGQSSITGRNPHEERID